MTASEAPSIADQYARVFDQLLGHVAITVAGIGLASGLFAALRDRPGGRSAEAIAADLDYERRAVEVWCRSAFAFELLDRDRRPDSISRRTWIASRSTLRTLPTWVGASASPT